MANYIVQPGETLSQIAKKMNVPISMISGYKSGDPNVILPGENLSVGQMDQPPQQPSQPQPNRGAAIAGLAQQITSAPGQPSPILPQQPQQPIAATQTPQQPGQPQLQQPGQPQLQQPGQPQLQQPGQPSLGVIGAIQQQINALKPQIETLKPQAEAIEQPSMPIGATPSGITAEVTDNKVLDRYGISPSNLEYGFQTNPQKTIFELVKEVMSSIGLPDISSNIADISKQIEDLENERDDEIERIQINPWTSAGSKQELIRKIDDRYEKKIGNRTNRLTLMQGAYNNARQEAQFAATTAISLYDKNRNYDIRLLEDAIKTAEREAAAKLKLGPLTTETIDGFTVLRDAEGNIVSTLKPTPVEPSVLTVSPYSEERAKRTIQSVDELMGQVNNFTVGWGALLRGIPTSRALSFATQLDTLKANIAFNELTAMREASKTGGALGQVSDREGVLLQSALGGLDQKQSPRQFKIQLQKVKDSINRWKSQVGQSESRGDEFNNDPLGIR